MVSNSLKCLGRLVWVVILSVIQVRALRLVQICGSLLILFLIFECGCNFQYSRDSPIPQNSSSLENTWFSNRRFGITGLVFFDGRLYASTDRGLLEFSDRKLIHHYSWSSEDDLVEELSFDRANKMLWFRLPNVNKMVRYDGTNWSFAPTPVTDEEKLSRSDQLKGFIPFSTNDSFYLQGMKNYWKWDEKSKKWNQQATPKLDCHEPTSAVPEVHCFEGIATSNKQLFSVIRKSTDRMSNVGVPTPIPTEQTSDVIFVLDKSEWLPVPNTSHSWFSTKKAVSGRNEIFILAYNNQLLRVDANSISAIDPPGQIGSLVSTENGRILISIEGDGIYEYNDGWHRLFQTNDSNENGRSFPHLTENGGNIAFAVNYYEKKKDIPCPVNQSSSLWIFDGTDLRCAMSSDK